MESQIFILTILGFCLSVNSANITEEINVEASTKQPVVSGIQLIQDESSINNETTNTVVNNGTQIGTRDPRVLSFIRNLLFGTPSQSAQPSSNYNQYQAEKQYLNYPEVDKYGEYNKMDSSYPVSAQYQIGSPASSNNVATGSGYVVFPSASGVQSQNVYNQAAANTQYPNYLTNNNNNYNNEMNNYYAQQLLAQLQLQQQQLLQQQQQQQQQSTSSGSNSILTGLMSLLGLNSLGSASSGSNNNNNDFLNPSASSSTSDFDLSGILGKIFDLGTNSMENLVTRMNRFDKLKCIPRLVCQTIARRQEEASTTTTTTSTRRPRLLSQDFDLESDNRELPNNKVVRNAKFIKFQGIDTALEQFVSFLNLMQLKDWSLYPLLNGAYEGSQVKKWDECRQKFETCPFSDQQLVYYFNNYNGGFFQTL